MLEKILFETIAFALFTMIFFKMIEKNDSNYVYILTLQAIGIIIQSIALLFNIHLNFAIILICYILSIIIPAIVVIIEKKSNLNLSELICFFYSIILKDDEKIKNIVMQLIEKYPNSYYAHKLLAQIYEKEQNYSTATQEYIRALESKKDDYNLYYKIAKNLDNIDKKEEAIQTLNTLLKRKPDYHEASMLLIDILYDQERFKEAITVCQDALKYNPTDYDLYYNLGMIYTRLNDFQKAKEYYEKAAQLNSLLYIAKYSLGQIALIYNELEEAQKYFMECTNSQSIEDSSYYYLAYIEMLKKNRENAINYLNVAVEENKKYYDKAKKEVVFRPIINYINKPTKEKEKQMITTKKEEQTILHLEDTYELVGNLNKDIKEIKIENKQQEKEHEIE